MGRQNAFVTYLSLIAFILVTSDSLAQSSQYKRKKKATPEAAANPVPGAPAPAPKAAPTPSGKDEKLDVSGLEEKYWSSQDTDFTVVQNRTYTKVGRVSTSLSLGMPANDSYNSGFGTTLAVNYYWSERMGVELSYTKYDFKNSKLVDDFIGSFGGVRPDSNRDTQFIGLSYNWIPIYAKASLLGSKILYFDFGVSPGIGLVNFDQFCDTLCGGNKQGSAIAYTVDFTQQFFLSKELAVRFDFKNRWAAEQVIGYANANRGKEVRKDLIYSSFLVFGLTYFF
jgi:outer membrane beta-barrel protein